MNDEIKFEVVDGVSKKEKTKGKPWKAVKISAGNWSTYVFLYNYGNQTKKVDVN